MPLMSPLTCWTASSQDQFTLHYLSKPASRLLSARIMRQAFYFYSVVKTDCVDSRTCLPNISSSLAAAAIVYLSSDYMQTLF